jgi:hypothetical protein
MIRLASLTDPDNVVVGRVGKAPTVPREQVLYRENPVPFLIANYRSYTCRLDTYTCSPLRMRVTLLDSHPGGRTCNRSL